jgi:hypothetical protein
VNIRKCPKAHSLKRPTDPVRFWDLFQVVSSIYGCYVV